MNATAELEPIVKVEPKAAPPAEPKVNQPHPWAGRSVFYWRVIDQTTGEIAPLPAMLIEQTRASEGWELNFWRKGQMQGRTNIKFSDKPKAFCFTFPPDAKPAKSK